MTLAIAVLTGLLVVVTGYYAWQTRQTVKVMEKQLTAAVRPMLVIRWESGYWHIENAGMGPAVNGRYTAVTQTGVRSEQSIGPLGAARSCRANPGIDADAHLIFRYEDVQRNPYWTRYCPRIAKWETEEGILEAADYGCDCQLAPAEESRSDDPSR